ncbi:MAG: VanZ family protein, partial [Oscillospiraceae bacterium]
MRRSFLVFFVIYILLLLTFTLFDDGFGRNEKNFFILTGDPFIQSVKESVNLVPFKTIKLYLRNIARDRITVGDFAINMLGNLAALAPMGFFLPLLFKKQRHWYAVAFTTSLVVAMIELLQLVFQKGSCDIDDLLLNVAGAVAAYTICWSKPVARQIDRLTHRARFTQ